MADFEAELPIYLKSLALAKFVTNSSQTKLKQFKNVPQAIESRWIDFYQRGYIEIDDVINLQKWLQTLCDIGYTFPIVTETKNSKSPLVSDLRVSEKNPFIEDLSITTSYEQSKNFLMDSKEITCQSKGMLLYLGIVRKSYHPSRYVT